MKVIHVIDSLGFGGAEMSLAHILPELAALGVQSEVACFRSVAEKVTIAREIPIHIYPGQHPPSTRQAARWLRPLATGADLIHTHLHFSTLAGRAAATPSQPVVTTLHNVWYGDAFIQTYPWPGQAKVRWMRWREKSTLGPHTHLLAVSRAVAESFAGYAGWPTDRIGLISNAIAEVHFQPVCLDQGTPRFPLVAMGRMSPEKNQATILKALKLLPEKGRPPVHLFGEGPTRGRLEAEARAMGLEVFFPGLTKQADQIFSRTEIFINASKIEGQALVVLEALAHGIPCLLSDIGPHREVAGDAALYFPPQDAAACAQKIRQILDQPNLRAVLASKSRARAEIAHPAAVARQIHAYYRQVLAGGIPPTMGKLNPHSHPRNP